MEMEVAEQLLTCYGHYQCLKCTGSKQGRPEVNKVAFTALKYFIALILATIISFNFDSLNYKYSFVSLFPLLKMLFSIYFVFIAC